MLPQLPKIQIKHKRLTGLQLTVIINYAYPVYSADMTQLQM